MEKKVCLFDDLLVEIQDKALKRMFRRRC